MLESFILTGGFLLKNKMNDLWCLMVAYMGVYSVNTPIYRGQFRYKKVIL